jgi:hypothetical protein
MLSSEFVFCEVGEKVNCQHRNFIACRVGRCFSNFVSKNSLRLERGLSTSLCKSLEILVIE